METTTVHGWDRAFASGCRWTQEAADIADELFSRAADPSARGRGRKGHRRHHGGPWAFGAPPFMGPWMAEGRPRKRRGDVRLAVLTLLAEQPMHGYQIITELSERSEGAWRPSPGSVYPTLQQLEDEGLVTVAEQEGRRTFSLTDAGRDEVARLSEGRRAPWEEMAEGEAPGGGRLKGTAFQVLAAAMQVAMVGDETQQRRADELLVGTRRDLYRLLAEEDGVADDDAEEDER